MEGEVWKAMGEEYSRTTAGYFHTVKEYADEDQKRFLTCYAYALGTFGAKLEEVAGDPWKKSSTLLGKATLPLF